jgi:TPR repeat protein
VEPNNPNRNVPSGIHRLRPFAPPNVPSGIHVIRPDPLGAVTPGATPAASSGGTPGAAPAPGTGGPHVGGYELIEEIGSGPVGRVFKCADYARNRFVAIKVARDEIRAPQARELFLHQAERAAAVRHANICPVYEVGLDGERPYVVMPFFQGGTLTQWRRKNRLPPITEALERVRGLAEGLAALHSAGVVHLALKPDNIFVDGRHCLIADHGWGYLREGAEVQFNKTSRYMSPEQWRTGGHPVGPRSDVFSLGVILFQLLTNAHPYPWLTDDVIAQGAAAWTQRPRAPSEVLYGLDKRLDQLCLGALSLLPGERYASAEAFIREIDTCREGVAEGLLITAEEDFKRGEEYYYGAPGIPRDPTRARKLFEKAAAQGYAPAQNSLGCIHQHALGVPRDYAKARELFELATKQGDARAQNNLGYVYQAGLGVPKNYAKARELYLRAAKQGDAAGQYNLGFLYMHALGVPRDYAKARELYLRAADQGFAKAQNGLGYMYQNALGVEQNFALAIEFFEKAAKQGFGVALHSLGYTYLKGYGVPRDYIKARAYIEKASRDHGIAQAHNALGYMHQYGLGVEQDFARALELYKKAAKTGLPEALFNLGRMYQNALGVKRNEAVARNLYLKAAAQGDEDAIRALEKLERKK